MAKSKKSSSSSKNKGDLKVTTIVVGLFAAVVIFVLIFSKAKESQQEAGSPLNESVETPVQKKYIVESVPLRRHIQLHQEKEQPVELPASLPGSGGGKIAFILDDWGQSLANCHYLKEISEPLAVSILPGLRHTKDVAACAQANHKLAMLHLPLEALHNFDFYPPNYIIKTNMPLDLASRIVEDDLNQLPTIQGVNNHMGSKATEDRPLMAMIFKKVKRRHLFFVDSVTASHTVCARLADEMDLPFARRNVFLDDINTREAITKQMMALAKFARRHGYAVAIGHDRHLTMQVLKEEIPWLESQGFEIVSIKELLRNK